MCSASSPRHVGVCLAVQQPHRTVEPDRRVEQQPRATVVDQRAGDRVGLAVLARPLEHAVTHQLEALLGGHRLPHQPLGEVGGGGDADQRRDPAGAGEGGQ